MSVPVKNEPSDEQMEDSYQKFKRYFEESRELYGDARMRTNLKAFRTANEHHASMVPMLDRLERELLRD